MNHDWSDNSFVTDIGDHNRIDIQNLSSRLLREILAEDKALLIAADRGSLSIYKLKGTQRESVTGVTSDQVQPTFDRLAVMAGLNIEDLSRFQQGRVSVALSGVNVDFIVRTRTVKGQAELLLEWQPPFSRTRIPRETIVGAAAKNDKDKKGQDLSAELSPHAFRDLYDLLESTGKEKKVVSCVKEECDQPTSYTVIALPVSYAKSWVRLLSEQGTRTPKEALTSQKLGALYVSSEGELFRLKAVSKENEGGKVYQVIRRSSQDCIEAMNLHDTLIRDE